VDEGARQPSCRHHRHQGDGTDGARPERHRALAPAHRRGRRDSLRRLQTDFIISIRRTGTTATPRSRRRCAPSTTWSARARSVTSAPRTITRGDSRVPCGRAIGAPAYVTSRSSRIQPRVPRRVRARARALCLEQSLGVIPYSSLGSGFLSGKYHRGRDLPKTARAGSVQKIYMTDRGFTVLEAVEKVAAAPARPRRRSRCPGWRIARASPRRSPAPRR